MLAFAKISKIVPYSPEWFTARLGMMTSSPISCICASKGIGDGGLTYIRNKVYEKITGFSSERNITTEGTTWGISQEPIAIADFKKVHQIPMIITDKHIIYDSLYSSTPDGLLVMNKDFSMTADQEFINCETLESKSYMTPSIHMEHVECTKPADIKIVDPKLYWQVLSQVFFANVLVGHAIFFHPHFPESSKYRLGHVRFSKLDADVRNDLKFFGERIEQARKIYNEKLEFSLRAA